jgi:hypothetical protein
MSSHRRLSPTTVWLPEVVGALTKDIPVFHIVGPDLRASLLQEGKYHNIVNDWRWLDWSCLFEMTRVTNANGPGFQIEVQAIHRAPPMPTGSSGVKASGLCGSGRK